MKKILAFAAFAATIPAANWMIQNVGTICIPQGPCLIPVGFGLDAPSGVLMIGLALVLRDHLQEVGGLALAALAVSVGVVLSATFSAPGLVLASAVSFAISEAADLAVYTKLRARGRPFAVIASQIVGAIIDSAAFLWLAFGSLDHAAGNVLGKVYAGAAVAVFLWVRRK